MTYINPNDAMVDAMALWERADRAGEDAYVEAVQIGVESADDAHKCGAIAATAVIADALAERDAEIARLRKLVNPTWFFHPDCPETCYFSPWEVIDGEYDPAPGEYVFEVDCATSMPSIWCAVHVSDDTDADERFTLTEHASEAEARAALGSAKV